MQMIQFEMEFDGFQFGESQFVNYKLGNGEINNPNNWNEPKKCAGRVFIQHNRNYRKQCKLVI